MSEGSQAERIGEVVAELRAGHGRDDATSARLIEKALAAGMTADGIAAVLADLAKRPGQYTDAEPSHRHPKV